MIGLVWFGILLLWISLLAIAGVNIRVYMRSPSALNAQSARLSSDDARALRLFVRRLPSIAALQRIEIAVIGVVMTTIVVTVYGAWLGMFIAVGLAVAFLLALRLRIVRRFASYCFEHSKDLLVATSGYIEPFLVLFVDTQRLSPDTPMSVDELTELVSRMPSSALGSSQKSRLKKILTSLDTTTAGIMTNRVDVVDIAPDEIVGPIVLSELKKSGHGFFPVVSDSGEVEGVLSLTQIADVSIAKSQKYVRDVMQAHVSWVEEDTSMPELAAAFVEDKAYIVLVRDTNGEYCGIVTISDLLGRLLGEISQ